MVVTFQMFRALITYSTCAAMVIDIQNFNDFYRKVNIFYAYLNIKFLFLSARKGLKPLHVIRYELALQHILTQI